jgi:hypothetical protein
MFTFDRKPRPPAAYSPAPKPGSQRLAQAPVSPLWFRLATSSNTEAAASPEMTEERGRYFEPILPLAAAPPGHVSGARMRRAEASPTVAPQPQFDFARIPIMPPPIQRKAIVSSPGDAHEREADEVADKVIRMAEPAPIGSAPAVRRGEGAQPASDELPALQPKCAPFASADATSDAGLGARAVERGGQPLSGEIRSYFEPRFRHDFGSVRVHTGSEAAETAHAFGARAFTLGRHIVFGAGEYGPSTTAGRRLLAHELTHVVQQRSGLAPGAQVQRQANVGSTQVFDAGTFSTAAAKALATSPRRRHIIYRRGISRTSCGSRGFISCGPRAYL